MAITTEELLQKISLAVSYVVQNMDGFSDFQATQIAELYPAWHTDVDYKIGQIVRYDKNIYRCVQAHKSQSDWTPNISTSLWSSVSYTEGIENWKQPTGAHDAYNVGDRVMYEDVIWVSTVNGNVWAPGVYGWNKETSNS